MSYLGLFEISAICLLILIIILCRFGISAHRLAEERALRFVIVSLVAVVFTSALTKSLYSEHLLNDALETGNHIICHFYTISMALYMTVGLLLSYTWFSYIFLKASKSAYTFKRLSFIFAIPLIIGTLINLGLIVFSIINDCTSSDLVFSKALPLIDGLGILYVLGTLFFGFRNAFTQKTTHQRREGVYLATITLIPTAAVFLQKIFPNVLIIAPVFTLTMLHIYISILRIRITADPLTGVNNKTRLIEYLQHIMQQQNPSKRLFYMVIEIDYFKEIIKEFGYDSADRVLIDVAMFLKNQCRDQMAFLSRTGKNQFSITIEHDGIPELESFCQRLVRECEKAPMQKDIRWKISFSIYFSEFGTNNAKDISSFLASAKSNCYKAPTITPIE